MGLPKSRRIDRTSEFHRVRADGRSKAERFLVLGILPVVDAEGEKPANRYGFVTSRKVGNAVTRNRVRRRLRAIAREIDPELITGHLVVTVARHSANRASYAELREQWYRLARKGGLLLQSSNNKEIA